MDKNNIQQWMRYGMVFICLGIAMPIFGQYSETTHRDLEEGEIPVSDPGYYGESGATYVLVNDINATRSAIFLGNNVTLDLNGYEIVYADAEYGHVPNYGFEEGMTSWDVTRAPLARMVNSKEQVFVGDSALFLAKGEEIVSEFVDLPIADRSYFAMCGVAKNTMLVSVFVEDESGENVISINPYGNSEMQGCPVESKHPQLGGGFVFAHFREKPAGKYRIRIRAETDAIIDQVDVRPALDVGVGIVERTFTNTHTNHMYDGWYDPAFYDYTQEFGKGIPVDGVPVIPAGSQDQITIKNGVIRSAARGILSWGIQSTASRVDLRIDNLKVIASGINTNAVEVIAAKITNCYFDIETPFIINRHNSGNYAVDLRGTQSSEVSHSEFYGGQGCLSFRGNNTKIHHNFFENRQTVTNHYSIGGGGRFSEIYNNVFKPESGSGIGFGGRDIKIYGNEIHIEAAPPTCEYGHEDYSVNGIRLADYNAPLGDPGGCFDNHVFDNTFYITGKDYPEYDDYIPVATAIFYSASAGDNFIYDNEVVVNALDPQSKAVTTAFYVGGGTVGGVFENNKITSNVPAFWLASPYGSATKTKVIGNTITRAPDALDDYAPIRLGSGGYLATNIDFVSNKIEGGNGALEFDMTRSSHTYAVYWRLKVETNNSDGSPAEDQNVKIYDRKENLVVDSITGNDGVLEVLLKEYDFYNRLEHDFDPYRISVGDKEETFSLEKDTSWTVTVDIVTSTQNEKKSIFTYGPNPVDSMLHLEFSGDGNRNIRIFDSQKSIYVDSKIRGRTATLDVSNLPPGSYFLQVKEEGGIYTRKLIKH